jgi:hypothetical protein
MALLSLGAWKQQSALKFDSLLSSPTTRIDSTGINVPFTQSIGTHLEVFFLKMKQHNFITKFCFYTLPTGDRLHRRDSIYDNRCPTCHASGQTDAHLLQCLSPARRAWRSDLIRSLIKPIDSFLDPVLLDILWEGLLCWFCTESIYSTPYPPRYQRLLKQQRSIGWNNLI